MVDTSQFVLSKNFDRHWILICLFALCLNTFTFAQVNSRPGSVPLIPDVRKPNRNIQPTLTPAPQSQTPAAAVGGENVSSESTLFTFDFEPADHPVMPSVESLMQISVTLYQTDQNYSGSPKS